jgi:hypothetical protein
MAYWFPPFTKAFLDGESTAVSDIVNVLQKGGFPVARKSLLKNPGFVHFGAVFLNLFVRNLEVNNWKLNSFEANESSALLKDSTIEGFEIISRKYSVKVPAFKFLLSKLFYVFAIKFAQRLMPFDLENYLKVHFIKVAPQMKKNLLDLIDDGQRLKLPLKNLSKLK